MNIHITNKETFESLKAASFAACQFGSHLYRTNDELSDKDIHYVYATSVNETNSFLKSHHHLQWKSDDIDHIFVNLQTFIKNTINGDSTVLFEVIQSGELMDTPLSFIYDMKDAFINYSIIRSYLGFANRDCKHWYKKETHREQLKALGHIYRGYYFAKSLMEGNFSLINDEFLETFHKIKLIEDGNNKVKKLFLQKGQELVTNIREELNQKFNSGNLNLPKYMSIENQVILDTKVNELIGKWSYVKKRDFLTNFDMTPFYNAFENEINY